MSTVAEQITQKLADKVKALLIEKPVYRDSDRALIVRIWSDAVGGVKGTKGVTFYDFLLEYLMEDGRFLTTESVGRARRKIQQECPELRGKSWKEKHEEEAKVVAAVEGLNLNGKDV